jgi:hypothetical protein
LDRVWLIALVLLFLGWTGLQYMAAQRKHAERALTKRQAALALEGERRQRELALFEHEQAGKRWAFDFHGMRVALGDIPVRAEEPSYAVYDLKRGDSGAWYYRLPDASPSRRVALLKPVARDQTQAEGVAPAYELETLAERPEWVAVPEVLAAKVEVRYELFLRHFQR